jgi:hypothetical protein
VFPPPPSSNLRIPVCIMATVPISAAYFINSSRQPVHARVVARQRLGNNIAAATNTLTTIEESVDAFYIGPYLIKEKQAISCS